jgi:hypothetical protein
MTGALGRLTRALGRLMRALRDFARGFVGWTPIPREPHAARHALERRAAGRRSCC